MSRKKIIAEIISLVLSPLVIVAPLPFFLVYEKTGDPILSIIWSLVSALFIFIFFLAILFGIKIGIFSDINVSKREQRPLLFTIGMVLALVYFATLFLFHAPQILLIGTTTIFLGLIVLGIVNRFTKASGHLAVLSAFITFLIISEGWKALIIILLIPLLSWARIKTKNHTFVQTILGTLVGSITIITLYVIFKYILGYV